MPAGQYIATGFMYLNLGCHMMFVLKNRLKAQGIPTDKTIKIIEDLVEAIFKPHLVRGVLAVQEPMPVSSLRDVFRKLAHSSIMKLDSSSMEKLIFLIVMTLKKQFFLTSSPLEIYSITRGNLSTLANYVTETASAQTLQTVLELFTNTASSYGFMEYHQLREYVLSVMESYQTKVVNFSEVGLQTEKGKLIYIRRNSHNQQPLASGINAFLTQKTTYLPLNDWKNWKTSLVLDHPKEYEKQSERRHAKNEQANMGKEKSLNDLFGLGQAVDFDVRLELFDYGETQPKGKPSQIAKTQSSNNKATAGGKSESSKIRDMIEGQFKEVQQQVEDEIDLLDMMDHS